MWCASQEVNMDKFEIYNEGFQGCERLLKNGKAINEFGMLKEVEKRDSKIKELKSILFEASEQIYDLPELEMKIQQLLD